MRAAGRGTAQSSEIHAARVLEVGIQRHSKRVVRKPRGTSPDTKSRNAASRRGLEDSGTSVDSLSCTGGLLGAIHSTFNILAFLSASPWATAYGAGVVCSRELSVKTGSRRSSTSRGPCIERDRVVMGPGAWRAWMPREGRVWRFVRRTGKWSQELTTGNHDVPEDRGRRTATKIAS